MPFSYKTEALIKNVYTSLAE